MWALFFDLFEGVMSKSEPSISFHMNYIIVGIVEIPTKTLVAVFHTGTPCKDKPG